VLFDDPKKGKAQNEELQEARKVEDKM